MHPTPTSISSFEVAAGSSRQGARVQVKDRLFLPLLLHPKPYDPEWGEGGARMYGSKGLAGGGIGEWRGAGPIANGNRGWLVWSVTSRERECGLVVVGVETKVNCSFDPPPSLFGASLSCASEWRGSGPYREWQQGWLVSSVTGRERECGREIVNVLDEVRHEHTVRERRGGGGGKRLARRRGGGGEARTGEGASAGKAKGGSSIDALLANEVAALKKQVRACGEGVEETGSIAIEGGEGAREGRKQLEEGEEKEEEGEKEEVGKTEEGEREEGTGEGDKEEKGEGDKEGKEGDKAGKRSRRKSRRKRLQEEERRNRRRRDREGRGERGGRGRAGKGVAVGCGAVGVGQWVWGSGCGAVGVGQWVWGQWVWGSGCEAVGVGQWVWGSGCGAVGVRQWVWGSGCGAVGVGQWVWGSGCGAVG
ncbi:unnamed protein product, partial [Closterium sp. NIES-64]